MAATAPPASPYAEAVDSTRDLLAERARRHKRLVMGLCLGMAVAIGLALVLKRPAPLLVALVVPAFVIAYFALDLASVRQWRQRLLDAWARGDVDLSIFDSMLRQVPALPPRTIEGLLDTLPPVTGLLRPKERVLVADAHCALDKVSILRLWLRAAFWTVAGCGAAGVLGTGRIEWLVLWLPLLPSAAAWRVVVSRRMRPVRMLLAQHSRGGASSDEYRPSLLDQLNWDGVPPHCVSAWQAEARR
jgi:hypothetical protein